MEFRDPSNHHHQPPPLYQSPPHHPHQNCQPPSHLSHPSSFSSSFSFLPNPNPSSIHAFENPRPYHSSSSVDALRPPGVDPYPNPNPNPYAPHLPFGGPHSIAAQSYQQESLDYYYQLYQLRYAVNSSRAKVGRENTIADLETKKLKVLQCGAPADSVRVCSICNVVCNSDKVFALHLTGEKHKFKALGLPFNVLKPKVPAHTKALRFTTKAKHPGLKTTAKKALTSFVKSSVCDVCKINCKSQEVLNNHKLGKRHIRNLQKLQESLKPKPKPANDLSENAMPKANPCTRGSKAASEQTKKNAALATKEDLETKKQRVLNGGAAADAVRVCMQCNVVCNGQEVYNSHIVGKKHLAMINKQQQAAPVS